MDLDRRQFLLSSARWGLATGLANGLVPLVPGGSAAAEPKTVPVHFSADIEPLVAVLENTPRERVIEEFARRIAGGASYDDILAALFLAGIRNVQPRPSVGFKFHAVLAVNSVHLASQALHANHAVQASGSGGDAWLPIFWGLDYFKEAQARDVSEGDWTMGALDEAAVPDQAEAADAFRAAMEQWDERAADTAAAALSRQQALDAAYEPFYRIAGRDFRSIGHKAIYVAGSRRVLERIGSEHAEPVLRSLAYALLMHEGSNPARRDDPADRPWRENLERSAKVPAGWQKLAKSDDKVSSDKADSNKATSDKASSEATRELLGVLRNGSSAAACDKVVAMLSAGSGPQAVWDALYLGAAELLVRQPAIVALHAVTTTNALGWIYRHTASDATRRLVLLQNAAFLPLFRQAMQGRGQVGQFEIDRLAPAKGGPAKMAEILAEVGRNPMAAARGLLGYLERGGSAETWAEEARRVVVLKARESHDYKFSSAVLEDYPHISSGWRDRYVAASVFKLLGTSAAENPLVARSRHALG